MIYTSHKASLLCVTVMSCNNVCICPQDHVSPPASSVQMDPRGHGAGERPRRQHRDLRAQRLRHQLEQGYRSVSISLFLSILKIRVSDSSMSTLGLFLACPGVHSSTDINRYLYRC